MMNKALLSENQAKRLELPYWMLLCFAMFNAWQMGFVFFVGSSLSVDGRTPLPISTDNVTALIAVCYVLSILYMIFFPKHIVLAERISACGALLSVIGLYLPLSSDWLRLLIYVQVFFCCFMIGFETGIVVQMFDEKTTITYLTAGYAASVFIVALMQNDILQMSYSVFRMITVIMLVMMIVFFFRLPTNEAAMPVYAKKSDGIQYPKKLFAGIYILMFVSCLMMLCGPAAVENVRNGISVAYLSDAVGALAVYLLYRKAKIHPMHSISVFIALSVVGYLLMYTSSYVPQLSYVACVLIGFGFIPCQLQPLLGVIMMKSYPSKLIAPSIITIALVTVVIQSGIVELFRSMPNQLCLVYLIIMVLLAVTYLQIEPFLIYAMRRKLPDSEKAEEASAPEAAGKSDELNTDADPIATLTKREREVLELIGSGYSNGDIAKVLFISEHTVNDYTKKIYRKLDVHSRHAAAVIINQYKQ